MLPERLSNLICSLRPEEEKLCLTVQTDLTVKDKLLSNKYMKALFAVNPGLIMMKWMNFFAGKETEIPILYRTFYRKQELFRVLY